jgi:uncharacterized protein involved in cysteine biosynthesis
MDMSANVDFGGWIQKGFDLYKDNIGVLILAALIAVLLTTITGGILAGPMAAGLILIVLRLHDKSAPKPEVGDLFKGFEHFLQTFLFFLVWGVLFFVAITILNFVPCLGQLLAIALGFALPALLMFSLFLIVDKKMEFWPASMASLNKVKENPWPFLGLSVVSSIIGGLGTIACGIGIAVTLPIHICILAVTYRQQSFGGASA